MDYKINTRNFSSFMTQNFFDIISLEKLKKIKNYKNSYPEMVADYQRELETVKGYNGRQILELLQNCDDQGSKKVKITLDSNNCIFCIENDGMPFSAEGYRSLFISNLSSKVDKKKFIGNKGLGFRSIINWSEQIEIISNNISLVYAPEKVAEFYGANFTSDQRDQISKEFNFDENEVPVALLTMPVVSASSYDDFVTCIKVRYRKKESNNILEQLKNIKSEILLFLNNLEEISVEIDGEKEIIKLTNRVEYIEEGLKVSKQDIGGISWKVFTREGEIDNKIITDLKDKETSYQIKIAISDNFEYSNPYLFSFFPTNIQFDQDYILHATFELDSTRNQIIDSEKNKFLLKEIVDFLINVAKTFSSKKSSFDALRVLNIKHRADILQKYGFYDLVEEALQNEEIYPCIDGNYRKKSKIFFVNNILPQMLLKYDAQEQLPMHLIPITDEGIQKIVEQQNVDANLSLLDDVEFFVSNISKLKLLISDRVSFVNSVITNIDENIIYNFEFLIDEHEQIIDPAEDIYTFPSKSNSLIVPDFTKIKTINKEFYFRYNNEYNSSKIKSNTRFFYDTFRPYCKIHEYDIVPLINRIISKTNELLTSPVYSFSDKKKIMHDSLTALFKNYLQLDDKDSKRELTKLLLLAKDNSFKPITELFLNDDFPTGKILIDLLPNVYLDKDYIVSISNLGLEDESHDILLLEEFFLWLGINKFFKFKIENKKDWSSYGVFFDEVAYIDYVRNSLSDWQTYTSYNITYTKVDEKVLQKLDVHVLLTLCYLDDFLSGQLSDRQNTDSYRFYYRTDRSHNIKPSFIKYQINSSFKLENFVIEDKYNWINDVFLDFNNEYFKKYKIGPSAIKSMLVELGAVESFEDSSHDLINRSFDIFNQKFSDGKGSQTFYMNIVKILERKNLELIEPARLFANIEGKIVLRNNDEIYFSDNNFLPSQLTPYYPILNFPLRAGAKEAIRRLNINNLDELDINIKSIVYNEDLTNKYEDFFAQRKPYVLAYRLQDVDKESSVHANLNYLNRFQFKICSEVICSLEETNFSLGNNSFVYDKKNKIYYINVSDQYQLSDLKRDPAFIDNFSEILTTIFSTKSEKVIFESLLKDDSNTINYNIAKDLGNTALEDAKLLLGHTSSKKYFWSTILQLIDIPKIDEEQDIDGFILSNFPDMVFSIDYNNYNNPLNYNQFKILFSKLKIEVQDFNNLVIEPIILSDFNYHLLENEHKNFNHSFKCIVYEYLEHKIITEQENLVSYFNKYNGLESSLKENAESLKDYFLEDSKSYFISLISSFFPELNFYSTIRKIDLKKIFTNAKSNFTEEENFTIRQNEKWQSLLYFNEIDYLKQLISESKLSDEENDEAEEFMFSKKSISNITILEPKNYKTVKRMRQDKNNGVYKGKSSSDKALKIIGNRAEDAAFELLVKEYGEEFVQYKAEEKENLHYDILYSDDKGDSWRYVEVKSSTNNRFFITIDEKIFGELNKENYDIWLFKNSEFKVLSKFFCDNQILNATEFEVWVDF